MELNTKLYITGASAIWSTEPDYKEFIQDALLRRRMSKIVRMGVAASIMALNDAGVDKPDAIVTGTGWGCLTDTEKFLTSIISSQEKMLNPSSFVQSTSNTVSAQIALLLGLNNYNNTFVQGGTSFEYALMDAYMLMMEGKTMILAGGFDELTPTKSNLLERMGFWRDNSKGEGAAFFLLTPTSLSNTIAVINSVSIYNSIDHLEKRLDDLNRESMAGCYLFCGGTELTSVAEKRGFDCCNFKKITGEFPTATALALYHAVEKIREDHSVNKIVLINRYINDPITLIEIVR